MDGLVALQEAWDIDPSLRDDASLIQLQESLIALHDARTQPGCRQTESLTEARGSRGKGGREG